MAGVRSSDARWAPARHPLVAAGKHAVALQIDDLLGLGDRKLDGTLARRMRVGAYEAMRPDPLRVVLFDDAGGLEVAVVAIWRRPDAVALVFDRLGRGLLGRAAGQPAQSCLEFREHGSHPQRGARTDASGYTAPPHNKSGALRRRLATNLARLSGR